jgi:dihydroxyacetone kinase-like predicted kinase
VEAGIEAGRPHRVRVTHFAEQAERRAVPRAGRAVVVVAAGAGLGDLFVRAGATVVPGGPGRRPSTAQVLEAVTGAEAAEVVVLPNDRGSVAVAEAAARTARQAGDVRVAVIPTHAQVQGLAALAVHEPGRPFEQDVLEMTAAARHARSGAVTVAARRAMTSAGPCEPGDVLGAIEGDFVVVGADLYDVATVVVERLLGGGGELVTLVAGAGAGDLAERCAAYLGSTRPTVDVVVYDGGQPGYPLLVGVE